MGHSRHVLAVLALSAFASAAPASDLGRFVDPFMGTDGGGNTFPGASVPFAMIQWSPDTVSRPPGGYSYKDDRIRGFSLTRVSGAGCPLFGDFPFVPVAGPIGDLPGEGLDRYAAGFRHEDERAAPGEYHVRLASGVTVDLTTSTRGGIGVFTYPAGAESTLLVDAAGSASTVSDSRIRITSDRDVTGEVTAGGFCSTPDNSYTLHLVARFDPPFRASGTWDAEGLTPGATSAAGTVAGAFLRFPPGARVTARVGLSYVSVENARANLEAEVVSRSFGEVRNGARTAWESLLGRVRVKGGGDAERRVFYTSLYHLFLHPNVFSDVNGEAVGFDGRVTKSARTRYAIFSGWDIYRCTIQLLAWLLPRETSDMIESLVEAGRVGGGGLPRWPYANTESGVMVGDPSAIVIAAAHAFGARDFDTKDALDAILAGATRPGTRCRAVETRPYLADYLEKGYVPQGPQEQGHALWSAAVTLEYTSADFAIAQLARTLGREDLERTFLERARSWRRLWDHEYGVIRPREADGRFLEGFDPDRALPVSPFSWDGQQGFIEGSTRQYTWMVPYDLKGVFDAMGGPEEAVRRLDVFFTKLRGGFRSPYFDISNEPSFGTPYAYDFAGVPWKSQALVRRILREEFHPTPAGIPGNDDLGSMAAWYVWGAIGLYPGLPGADVLLVGTPIFDRITIRLGDGRTLRISGGRPVGEDWFVERLSRDGVAHGRPWLRRDELMGKAPTLQFTLRRSPSAWGGAPSEAPPSNDGPRPPEQ